MSRLVELILWTKLINRISMDLLDDFKLKGFKNIFKYAPTMITVIGYPDFNSDIVIQDTMRWPWYIIPTYYFKSI